MRWVSRIRKGGRKRPLSNGLSGNSTGARCTAARFAPQVKRPIKAEEYIIKAGKKAGSWLEKTKSFGPVAKKLARTYGPAVKKGLRLSPLVGKAVGAWDLGYAVGSKIVAPYNSPCR